MSKRFFAGVRTDSAWCPHVIEPLDMAMLDTPAPTSSTWDPQVRRCRNAMGRFTGPPRNAAAAGQMLKSFGYSVSIQSGQTRYRLRYPGGKITDDLSALGLVHHAQRQYERRTKR